ncbi:MAG: GDYXXLXY domain-containing protein [Planctomycetes bacterium]|nr:GDYXXLXY domain-containing protein [Planctomycetota bacterium]
MNPWWYWVAVAPQFALVGGLALYHEHLLATGREVVLEVRPFDPMDVLSGRYLALPLAIEVLDRGILVGAGDPRPGDSVWVELAAGSPFWTPVAVHEQSPPASPDRVVVRGELSWGAEAGRLYVRYPIDRFYIPETGDDPTTGPLATRPKLSLVVRVASNGAMALADLRVDGVPYARWRR